MHLKFNLVMKLWTVIENRKEYESALARIDELMAENPGLKTNNGKELKLLLFLIERYEEENFPISSPDPINAIKIRMEDLGLQAKDMVGSIGDKGTISKVLSRKLPLSLNMIRKLSHQLHLPADVLIKEIKLKAA
jgi:HTH-type transcriptional regulator/antitoxin HigA